jgi:hypothetical protein
VVVLVEEMLDLAVVQEDIEIHFQQNLQVVVVVQRQV